MEVSSIFMCGAVRHKGKLSEVEEKSSGFSMKIKTSENEIYSEEIRV